MIKALSLTQPWATLVALGEKKIETRSWQPRHRGPIAIHAAKGMTQADYSICRTQPFSTALRKHGIEHIADLPRGAILATARLTACVTAPAAIQPKQGSWEWTFGDFTAGRWLWVLEDIVALERPIAAKGMQGLWDWEPRNGELSVGDAEQIDKIIAKATAG